MPDNPKLLKVEWKLFAVMAEKDIRTGAELHRRLKTLGIDVTSIHVSRLVKGAPKLLNMELFGGILTVLACTPNDIIRVSGSTDNPREAGSGGASRKGKDAAPSNVRQINPSTGPTFRAMRPKGKR